MQSVHTFETELATDFEVASNCQNVFQKIIFHFVIVGLAAPNIYFATALGIFQRVVWSGKGKYGLGVPLISLVQNLDSKTEIYQFQAPHTASNNLLTAVFLSWPTFPLLPFQLKFFHANDLELIPASKVIQLSKGVKTAFTLFITSPSGVPNYLMSYWSNKVITTFMLRVFHLIYYHLIRCSNAIRTALLTAPVVLTLCLRF